MTSLIECVRLFVGQRVYRLGISVSKLGGAICGPERQW